MKALDGSVGMNTVEMNVVEMNVVEMNVVGVNVVEMNVVGIPPFVPPTHQHSCHSSCKQILSPVASHYVYSMTLQNIDIITIPDINRTVLQLLQTFEAFRYCMSVAEWYLLWPEDWFFTIPGDFEILSNGNNDCLQTLPIERFQSTRELRQTQANNCVWL